MNRMAELFDLLIRGGTIVSAQGRLNADVGIRGEQIVAVGDLTSSQATKVIDAIGKVILPGAVDTQVHFREPGMEHKEDIESGTRSAICGGVTAIFEMPNTNPLTISRETLEDKLDRASGRAWCDYAFFVGGCAESVECIEELEMMPGTPGVKVFMGSSTGTLMVEDDAILKKVMERGKRPMSVHSEDEARLRERYAALAPGTHVREHPHVRDPECAVRSTNRLLKLCEETGRPVHILHISTQEELPIIRSAKDRGLPVTCEATPHHLTLNSDRYEDLGTFLQMNPPVRSEEHRLALWEGVKSGLFDVFGSDHAPHTIEEKRKPYPQSPSGMPGVQTIYPMMIHWALSGEIALETVVQMLCERPCSLFGVKNKGFIKPGFDADICLLDAKAKRDVSLDWLQSKCGWSPYEGMELNGRIDTVILRGNVIVDNGALLGQPSGAMVQFDWK